MRFHLTKVSMNSKTGPIPVSMSSKDTCPESCSFKNNGCYAEYGPQGMHWRRLDNNKNAYEWDEFCNQINALRKNTLWRHNAAGDLPGEGDIIDHAALDMLVKANKGKNGFTFTHKPVGLYGQRLINAQAVFASNRNGFTINCSAESLSEADRVYDLGIGPVVVVISQNSPKNLMTPKGRHVIRCPAETTDLTCADCKLCSKHFRKAIVGFTAHGSGRNKVERRLKVIP